MEHNNLIWFVSHEINRPRDATHDGGGVSSKQGSVQTPRFGRTKISRERELKIRGAHIKKIRRIREIDDPSRQCSSIQPEVADRFFFFTCSCSSNVIVARCVIESPECDSLEVSLDRYISLIQS